MYTDTDTAGPGLIVVGEVVRAIPEMAWYQGGKAR